jgi:proteasome alpha subunit
MIAPDGMGVKRGATVIGIRAKDGVAVLADKKVLHGLMMARSIEKVYEIDNHIGAATTGLVADGRKLIEQARLQAQRHRLVYDEPVTVRQLVHDTSSYMQIFTQYGGLRPFGVTIIIAGYDDEPRLYEIDPSGTPTEWAATAVGEGRIEVMKVLDAKYSPSITLKDAFPLGIEALKVFLKDKFSMKRVEVAKITKKGFKKLSLGELEAMSHGSG